MSEPIDIGMRLAKEFFDRRSKPGQRNVEVHLSELELADLFAVAVKVGIKDAQVTALKTKQPARRVPPLHVGPTEKPVTNIIQVPVKR